MQLHYGCKRDNDVKRFRKLGPDTGFDCIDTYTPSAQLADLLNALNVTDELPKTILYSLNPNDNAAIGTIIGCFQDAGVVGRSSREAHGGSMTTSRDDRSDDIPCQPGTSQ